ncbi:MAG: response regulator [Pseudolabrys sp.]|nr:response regulator [Pseudolabrys sp.]
MSSASIDADVVGILDTIDVPIVVVGRDCRVVRFNRAAAQSLSLQPSNVGQPVTALADADLDRLCAQVIADGAPLRRDFRTGDQQFVLRVAPYATGTDTVGAVITLTNVTAFRASLDQALYEREYTKAILNTVSNPLVVLDASLRVQSANRAFYDMFGVARERTHGILLRNAGDDRWRTCALWPALDKIVMGQDEFEAMELECDFPRLGTRTVALDARRLVHGSHATVLLSIHDITERTRAEESLRNADRRKDEFLALLAHELRNPLAPIRTGLELIRLSGNNAQSVGRVRAMMERQVSHLVRLIDDLLDVSRIASGKIVLQRAPTSLNELVQSAVESQRSTLDGAHITLTVDLPTESPVVDVDSTRFVQVLSNVLHNASKFTPAAGNVHVSADLRSSGAAHHAVVTIADNGIGIANDVLPHIFELFTQAETATDRTHGGLGIGLALARRLIEMHGGTISAQSPGLGLGATFVITMPVCEDAVVLRQQPGDDVTPLTCRVVVIDDNVDAAQSLSMLIEHLGGKTCVAHDAAGGLEAVHDFRPDVVFLDIGMPGTNGYEVCRRIRQERSAQRMIVLAVTGWGQTQDKQRALDAGFDGHLTKPVDPSTLVRILAAHGLGRSD